jgi:hypothetical protein
LQEHADLSVWESEESVDGAAFSESGSSVASRSVVDVDDELDDAAAVAGHEFVEHYSAHRPHRSLRQRPPAGRTPPPSCATDRPLRRDRLGGLIHEYVQVACVTGFSAPTPLIVVLHTALRERGCGHGRLAKIM